MFLYGLLVAVMAYLLGSLPFSVWIGRTFFATDIRDHGSGNAGATNTWRVLGWKAGLPALLLDTGKGLAASLLPFIDPSPGADPGIQLWLRILCGAAAAVGHIYPVFAGFRGGKAVATLFGVIIGLMPFPAALSLLVFAIVFISFRRVSLGSIMAGLSLPFLVLFLTGHPVQLIILSLLISCLVLVTHTRNINRLIRGEEPKLSLRRERR